MQEYYQILGLEDGASKQEIQDAYDKLSVELDPKNNDDLDFFKEEFALLQEAYEKLMGHVPASIDNDSSEEIVKTQKSDTNSGKRALGDDETTLSLFKKYVNTDKQGKKEMVEVLEELQSHDKKYLDALQLIYKTEGVECFKEFLDKTISDCKKDDKNREEPILKKKGGASDSQDNNKKNRYSKTLIRLAFGILIILGIIYFIKINSIEKIYGCIDPISINYDATANAMLDSSCVRFKYLDWNDMYPKNKVYVDMRRYTDIEYHFIYNYTDTISKIYRTNYEYDDVYYEIQILNIDTIFHSLNKIDRNTDKITSFYLPAGKKIKVKEKVKGKRAKSYSINIIDEKKNEKNYLLNPRSNYRYKIEKAEYGKLAFGFTAEPIYKRGFIFELNHDIDYWFQDFPASITVYDNEYGLGLYIRRNINSY